MLGVMFGEKKVVDRNVEARKPGGTRRSTLALAMPGTSVGGSRKETQASTWVCEIFFLFNFQTTIPHKKREIL